MTKSGNIMEDLLKNSANLPIHQLRRGDVVEGRIIEVNEKEALVDVGAKSEGVIPQSEIKGAHLKVNDKVYVYVITPEDRRGQMVVSLARAETAKAWLDLDKAFKKGETLEVLITGHNRGGLIGDYFGLMIFVPFSHAQSASDMSTDKSELGKILEKLIGTKIKVRVIELDKDKNRIIVSEKEASIGEALDKRRENVLSVNVSDIVKGTISAIMPYGLMLSVNGLEGLIPREEITWDEDVIDDVLSSFEIGQTIDAQVISVDKQLGKVKLSIKMINENPWDILQKSYKVDDITTATIKRITSYGIFAEIKEGIEGMLPLSSLPSDFDGKIGQLVKVTITNLDAQKRQLDLKYIEKA